MTNPKIFVGRWIKSMAKMLKITLTAKPKLCEKSGDISGRGRVVPVA